MEQSSQRIFFSYHLMETKWELYKGGGGEKTLYFACSRKAESCARLSHCVGSDGSKVRGLRGDFWDIITAAKQTPLTLGKNVLVLKQDDFPKIELILQPLLFHNNSADIIILLSDKNIQALGIRDLLTGTNN